MCCVWDANLFTCSVCLDKLGGLPWMRWEGGGLPDELA